MFRFSSYIRNTFLAASTFATFSSPAIASPESSRALTEACTRPSSIGTHATELDRYPSLRQSLVYSVEIPSAGVLQIETRALREGAVAPRVSFLGRHCAEPEPSTGWEVLRADNEHLRVAVEHPVRVYFRLTSHIPELEGEAIELHTSFLAAETWQEHQSWRDTAGSSRQARITHFSFDGERPDFYLLAMDGFRADRSTVHHRALVFPRAYATGSGRWGGRVSTQIGAPSAVSEPIIVDPDPDTGSSNGGTHSVSEPIIVDPDPDTDPLYAGSEADVTWLFASSEEVILGFLLDSFTDEPAESENTLRRSSTEQEW